MASPYAQYPSRFGIAPKPGAWDAAQSQAASDSEGAKAQGAYGVAKRAVAGTLFPKYGADGGVDTPQFNSATGGYDYKSAAAAPAANPFPYLNDAQKAQGEQELGRRMFAGTQTSAGMTPDQIVEQSAGEQQKAWEDAHPENAYGGRDGFNGWSTTADGSQFKWDPKTRTLTARGSNAGQTQGLQPRGPAQVSAAPAASFQGASIGSDTTGAEAERKKMLSDIDSAMFRMGTPNMRSKRDMLMGYMGMKKDLEGQFYNTQNNRDLANAQMQNDNAVKNAELSDRGLARRQTADIFNADLGEKANEFGQTLGENRRQFDTTNRMNLLGRIMQLQAANNPNTIENQIKLAEARRQDAQAQVDIGNKLQERNLAAQKAYTDANPGATPEQTAGYIASLDKENSGPMGPMARTGERMFNTAVEDQLDKGTPWDTAIGSGDFRWPGTQRITPRSTYGQLNAGDYDVSQQGGVVGAWNRFRGNPQYKVTLRGRGDDGSAAAAYVDKATAESILKAQNSDAAAVRRRTLGQ